MSTGHAVARDAAERALWRMMSFFDTPLADLDAAAAADAGWLMPPLMKAGFLASLIEPALLPEATAALAVARARSHGATARELAHLEAVTLTLEGRWHQACKVWDDLLLEHPRDALALQWAHLWDFYRGDAPSLRNRVARALPEWDVSDPLYPYVLGLYAFGLEECNLHPQAEDAGRRATSGDACVPWAVHAVAHVMEMQGRYDDGAAWLRQQQPGWSDGNGFAGHLWWHLGLFRLEALDMAGVLRLIDAHLSGDALQITLHRVDAAALLWRLHLLDVEVDGLFRDLVTRWPLAEDDAGHYAFNDVHAVMALVGAGELQRADAWLARCAQRVLAADESCRANHAMAREVGLPLMRGLLAFARDDFDAAACAMHAVRAIANRFGGSHAQRDVIDQTLLAASARGSHQARGRALLNERLMAKAITPLTRHWAEQVDLREPPA